MALQVHLYNLLYILSIKDLIIFSKLDITQAEMEVKQKEEEIEKLQEALNKLINDAGVRTRQEVCIIYLQCCTNQTSPCCCYRLTYIYVCIICRWTVSENSAMREFQN